MNATAPTKPTNIPASDTIKTVLDPTPKHSGQPREPKPTPQPPSQPQPDRPVELPPDQLPGMPADPTPVKAKQENEGEGNRTADAQYRKSARDFVRSGQVEARAREAADAIGGPEGAELRKAEEKGKQPSRRR